MQIITQALLNKDEKMHKYLHENSGWYKYLNRNARSYNDFVKVMKKQYHLNPTDKISDALDNIDLISTVIQTIK